MISGNVLCGGIDGVVRNTDVFQHFGNVIDLGKRSFLHTERQPVSGKDRIRDGNPGNGAAAVVDLQQGSAYLVGLDQKEAVVGSSLDFIGNRLAVQQNRLYIRSSHGDAKLLGLCAVTADLESFPIAASVVVQGNVLKLQAGMIPIGRETGRNMYPIAEGIDPDAKQSFHHKPQISTGNIAEIQIAKIRCASCGLDVGCHAGISAGEIAIRDAVQKLFALFFKTYLEIGQGQMGIFCRENAAVGVLLGQPVGGIAQSAPSSGSDNVLNVIFSVTQRAISFPVIDHVRIDDMVYRGQLGRRVDQAVTNSV